MKDAVAEFLIDRGWERIQRGYSVWWLHLRYTRYAEFPQRMALLNEFDTGGRADSE